MRLKCFSEAASSTLFAFIPGFKLKGSGGMVISDGFFLSSPGARRPVYSDYRFIAFINFVIFVGALNNLGCAFAK